MSIVALPCEARRKKSRTGQVRRRHSISEILRAAYRRHTRERLTLTAVKHCLG